jgi:DNA-binding XRE family transcriptional regulator
MTEKDASLAERNHLVVAIHAERLRQGLTQEDLAQAAGLSRRAVVQLEKGQECKLSTIDRLCRALALEVQVTRTRRPTLDDLAQENREEAFERPKG